MYYNLAMDDLDGRVHDFHDSFRLAFTGDEGAFAPDLIRPFAQYIVDVSILTLY
jgi:hypothetical protein